MQAEAVTFLPRGETVGENARQIFREEDLLPPAEEHVQDVSPASAVDSMASVNAEHAEALGESSTNVVDIHEGGAQSHARTPRKAKA